VQPGYLGIPFDLVRGLTETYRNNLPMGKSSDVVLGIHCHVARDREEAIENGALALSSQADVFLRGRLSRPVETETIKTYSTKSASREAFEKLCTPEKARQAVGAEWPNVMAVWGTPEECVEKIKFYVDAMRPEQLMLNIASGSLVQDKVLQSMRLFSQEVMPALR
jgi:alkanesulfonate monooxygenase SsuD/methylene tetrahydromethanopterin reductase-like flavin-dependent oxidoreductase (luciferase family)